MSKEPLKVNKVSIGGTNYLIDNDLSTIVFNPSTSKTIDLTGTLLTDCCLLIHMYFVMNNR